MAIVVQYLPANALEIILVSFLFICLSNAFVSNAITYKLKEIHLKVISITLSLTVAIEPLVISFKERLMFLLQITRSIIQKCRIILYFFTAVMYLFIGYTFYIEGKSSVFIMPDFYQECLEHKK